MSRLCVVPQEPTENMEAAGLASWDEDDSTTKLTITRAIAARPPLPADIEAALEVAEQLVREGRSGDAGVLARSLLKACGREPIMKGDERIGTDRRSKDEPSQDAALLLRWLLPILADLAPFDLPLPTPAANTQHTASPVSDSPSSAGKLSRSEQVGQPEHKVDTQPHRSTPASPAGPSAMEEVAELRMNISVHRWESIPHSFDRMLKRHAEELDRLRAVQEREGELMLERIDTLTHRLSEAEKESAAWKQAHEDLLCVRQQDIAALSAKLGAYPLGCEIADLIHRMQRGDYSKGTALTLCARWLEMCERKATHNDH